MFKSWTPLNIFCFVDLTLETCQFYLIRMKKQSLKFEGKNLIIIAVYPFDIPHREELLKVTLEHNNSTCGERQRAVLQVLLPKSSLLLLQWQTTS